MTLRSTFKLVLEWAFRWIPVETEPGLRIFGNPNRSSPVLLTCNYDLTVRKVSRYLRGIDCYLLVAPSRGINVWCASCGGDLNEHSVISVIRSSRIDEKVDHRTLILPQLSAPGIAVDRVKEETGWSVNFGPVYAEDIPAFLEKGSKDPKMRSVRFDIAQRLEMATIYFVTVGLILLVLLLLFFRTHAADVLGLTAVMIYGMYIAFPLFPFSSGFLNTALSEAVTATAILSGSTALTGRPLGLAHLLITSLIVSAIVGLDFNGTSPTHKSDLGDFLYRRWRKRMRFLTGVYELGTYGDVVLNSEACLGCGICIDVCPKGVFEIRPAANTVKIARPGECVNCGACIAQCPADCLEIA